jgi:Patatin-like phospholipase
MPDTRWSSVRKLLTFRVRLVGFLALVVAVGGVYPNWPGQLAVASALILGFLITYRVFLLDLIRYLVEHPGQASILVLLLAMLYGQVGVSYGVPQVFWSEYGVARAFSAMAVTALLAVLGINAFYFDTDAKWTRIKTFRFLEVQRWKKDFRSIRRLLNRIPLVRRINPWLFRDIDGLRHENAHNVQQFLRARRLPFLTLASMPAIFPLLFPDVPRVAPVGEADFLPLPDVGRSGLAWMFGLAWWGLGVFAGILGTRLLLKLSTQIGRLEGLVRLLPRVLVVFVTLAATLNILNAFRPEEEMPTGSFWGLVGRVSWAIELVGWASGVLVGFVAVLLLVKMGTDPGDGAPGLRFPARLVIGSVLLAASMTCLDASRAIPALAGSRLWDWTLFLVDLAGLLMILVTVAKVTSFQHPAIWPKFFRYLVLVSGTLVVLVIWDRSAHWLKIPRFEVSPGMAVCILLAILSLLGAWFHLLANPSREVDGEVVWPIDPAERSRVAFPLFLGLVVWIGIVNNGPYKLRFPGLSYTQPVDLDRTMVRVYPELARPGLVAPPRVMEPSPLVDRMESLKAWYKLACKNQDTKHPKLVVVCSSGGASRAAFWTAVVLDRLSREADLVGFDQGVRMMTGASGGMVGAAYYVSHLYHERNRVPHRDPWLDDFETNPLPRLAGHIAMEGLPLMLLPRLPWLDLDRGIVLEDQFVWRSTRKPALGMAIQDLRELERGGIIPSLIFSPVIVDDGRRLLISNLDLASLAVNRSDELIESLEVTKAGSQRNIVSSLAALEFFKFFDQNGAEKLKLATAARMSASFPFASPAVNLPCDPPLRLVDAGYYDNFGVNLASIWIGENWRDLKALGVSGIVLVQIRAFLGRAERMAPLQGDEPLLDLQRGFELIGSPITAFGSGRFTGSVFRNDSELSALIEVVNEKAGPDFLTTVILENSSMVQAVSKAQKQSWPGMDVESNPGDVDRNTEVAMTWYVTGSERQAMQSAIPLPDLARRTVDASESPAESFDVSPKARLRWIKKLAMRVKDETIPARRDAISKDLERALNFERIEALKAWWKKGR